jgi:hypothetical protein
VAKNVLVKEFKENIVNLELENLNWQTLKRRCFFKLK